MNESEANPNMEQKCPQCGAPLPSGVLAGLCPACLFKQGVGADTVPPAESAPFQPPSVEAIARLFPQLEIIALIGKGGMGAVYKARQPGLDRIVALKVLPPAAAGGPGFIERFNREARALAKLNHPHIVAVFEFGEVEGMPFFIMEFVDGLNLRQLEQAGKLTAREALQIVPQICEALQFAHDEGIVHRDIKPENILLDKRGRVKIADFGIAKILGRESDVAITETGGAIGTPHYMAPEQMEKPTTVDHRADIFSLGVVFYEMLTGELPLGKFSPPSSRKVEVDVRLDDVVLRALEKDPERRYQHASQVKTAVNTIVGSAAGGTPPPSPPPPPISPNGEAMAREILARDYTLSIRSCVRRAWTLLCANFWPFVGINALMIALVSFAGSIGSATIQHGPLGHNSTEITSGLATLVYGPLMGGLILYFLKKIRNEKATVETAFSGFSQRFLQLFLAGFVTSLLTWLAFFCLIVPGIYLLVAWMFTLPLVMDKGLDFWSAMELSRKVITKHWWKFLGLGLVMVLLSVAGVMVCLVGFFVASPLVLLTLMYAYEDIFSRVAIPSAPAGTGPGGTVVMPPPPPASAKSAGSGFWSLTTKMGFGVLALAIGVLLILLIVRLNRNHPQRFSENHYPAAEAATTPSSPDPATFPTPAPVPVAAENPSPVFGPATELQLTNLAAINLASGRIDSLPSAVTGQSRGPEKDSATYAWMQQADMDLAYLGQYDGFYGAARNLMVLPRDDWENYHPDQLSRALPDAGQEVTAKFGNADSLNNPTNFIYGFKTYDGHLGLLRIIRLTQNPPAAVISYKLVQSAGDDGTQPDHVATSKAADENLNDRLDAVFGMSYGSDRDGLLAAIGMDAAQKNNVNIANRAIFSISDQTTRDETAHKAATLLAKHGLLKPAIIMAKYINDSDIRNQTLAELAK
ncbi:MAG TPA: protein kinase [Verrucomicrobiae bacterium]|jgi:serine/threonine protein kinase